MFTSVVFIAYFTAAVTSSLTVQQLRGDINGPEDLPGKRVGSIKGQHIRWNICANVALSRRNSPRWRKPIRRSKTAKSMPWFTTRRSCSFYAAHEGKGKVQTAGAIFRKENYGIVFPSEQPVS